MDVSPRKHQGLAAFETKAVLGKALDPTPWGGVSVSNDFVRFEDRRERGRRREGGTWHFVKLNVNSREGFRWHRGGGAC